MSDALTSSKPGLATKTMRAIVRQQFDGPEQLYLQDIPSPETVVRAVGNRSQSLRIEPCRDIHAERRVGRCRRRERHRVCWRRES